MRPDKVTDGMTVLYQPIKGRPANYLATVDGQPWQMGSRLVVNLNDLRDAGGTVYRPRLNAACLSHLRAEPVKVAR